VASGQPTERGVKAMSDSTNSQPDGLAYEFPKIEKKNGRPVFNLLVLGTRGGGKTVLLAAVGEQLSVLKDSAFMLKSSTTLQVEYLRSCYSSIRRASDDWPLPTVGSSEYEFIASCPVAKASKEHNLFWIRYKDFPGGYVETPRVEDDLSIHEVIQKAHIIIFLIDGSKVLYKKINKCKDDLMSLDDELNIIASYAQECLTRPIQFIITKWDVVKTYMSLEQVRDYLMENENFSAIVRQIRKQGLPAHLIPVSAVGDRFAEWDPVSNKMKKCRGATAQPYNLDVSMAFAISDAILQRSHAAISTAATVKKHIFKGLATGGPAVKWFTNVVISVSSNVFYDDGWLVGAATLIEKVAARVGQNAQIALDDIEARIQNAKDVNSAVAAIAEKQQFMAVKFLDAHPAANLLH
jgi:hypothetical protein